MLAASGRNRTRGFGVFDVDERSAELRKRGVRVRLQEQPFQILCVLLDHSGEVVTREELRQKLWPEHTFVDFDRSLNKAITKLRSALGDSADHPRYIETIPRHGYRFLAPVQNSREVRDDSGTHFVTLPPTETGNSADLNEAPVAVALASPHTARFVVPELPQTHGRAWLGRRTAFVLATLFMAILAGALYLRVRASSLVGSTAGMRQSVAVLGFKNLSGEAREDWLSTALSDWLMTELTAGEHVRAIPAESVARMKMELTLPDVDSLSKASLARIRNNLGTDYVVVGSYATLGQKSQGQIRLDLRLQDTRNGETIGAVSEIGTEEHLLDLVSHAGETLRRKLGIRAVTSEEAAEVAIALPARGEAAKKYSEGLAKLRVFDALNAQSLLQQASNIEPDFAPSHLSLAMAWEQLGYDEKAKLEAKNAFELSTNLSRAERLLVEGYYRDTIHDWDKAIEIHRALFDFFPDNLDYGLALANSQVKANRWRDALSTVNALHTLPPPLGTDPRIDLMETDAARSLGDMKRAETALAHAAEKAQAAGASLLLAKTRREQAWLFENSGKQDRVESAIRDAKLLYTTANDKLGLAGVVTLEAIESERHGDYLGAKARYEEALKLFHEAGSKLSVSNEYDNLGGDLLYLGALPESRQRYTQALETYREIGDENGEALAQIGLGDVSMAMGDHRQALGLYGAALDICRRLGSREREGEALKSIASVFRVEGDPEEAQKENKEALAIFEEVGDKTEAEHTRLQLAQLMLDEGKNSEAVTSITQSAKIFEEGEGGRYASEARFLLAQALLAAGQADEARRTIDRVSAAAAQSHNKELSLMSGITTARLEADNALRSGNRAAFTDSIKLIDHVIAEAKTGGYAGIVYEARLARGEIAIASADSNAGKSYLEGLVREANDAGFQLIVRQASIALQPQGFSPAAKN
ncbi:MAG: tetratricopeptide repeat protein [Acidobacteria bacterium]|nr:tetratricopeptide repeat protein [Acidobacteriota bacterium]